MCRAPLYIRGEDGAFPNGGGADRQICRNGAESGSDGCLHAIGAVFAVGVVPSFGGFKRFFFCVAIMNDGYVFVGESVPKVEVRGDGFHHRKMFAVLFECYGKIQLFFHFLFLLLFCCGGRVFARFGGVCGAAAPSPCEDCPRRAVLVWRWCL